MGQFGWMLGLLAVVAGALVPVSAMGENALGEKVVTKIPYRMVREGDTFRVYPLEAQAPLLIDRGIHLTEVEKRRLQRAINICYAYLEQAETWSLESIMAMVERTRELDRQGRREEGDALEARYMTWVREKNPYLLERVAPYIQDCAPYKLTPIRWPVGGEGAAGWLLSRLTEEEMKSSDPDAYLGRSEFAAIVWYNFSQSLAQKWERPAEDNPYVAELREGIARNTYFNTFVLVRWEQMPPGFKVKVLHQ